MPKTTVLRDIALRELTKAASAIAGFTFTRAEYRSAANISGLRTKTLTFSSRHDSRTQFASDNRYGHLGKAGAWRKLSSRMRQSTAEICEQPSRAGPLWDGKGRHRRRFVDPRR